MIRKLLVLWVCLAAAALAGAALAQDTTPAPGGGRVFYDVDGSRGRCQPQAPAVVQGGGGGGVPAAPLPAGSPMPDIAMSAPPTLGAADAALGTSVPGDTRDASGDDSGVAMSPSAQNTALRAGIIDDNALWDDYLLYRRTTLDAGAFVVRDVNVSTRHVIAVLNADRLPVLGALVRAFAGDSAGSTPIAEARTLANGQVLFFPSAAAPDAERFTITIEKDGQTASFTLDSAGGQRAWEVTLAVPAARPRLDVLFLIDTTGSMADEILQLQSNLLTISGAVDALTGDVRYGMVTYKDRGDSYVTCVYDFTPDVAVFQTDLNGISADGGGDTPESLNEGLHDALHSVEWRTFDTVSLIFLIADAAPHLDYPNDFDYAVEMQQAARMGVKIFPIGSSGLEPQGEYIFRQLAQFTQGQFIFLTYDGGVPGTPGDTRPDLSAGADPANFTVSALDELVVKLIQDELAQLGTTR